MRQANTLQHTTPTTDPSRLTRRPSPQILDTSNKCRREWSAARPHKEETMTASAFEIGLNSFGEVASDGGQALDDAQTVRLLVEEAKLAEASGLDVFSIGEHY